MFWLVMENDKDESYGQEWFDRNVLGGVCNGEKLK